MNAIFIMGFCLLNINLWLYRFSHPRDIGAASKSGWPTFFSTWGGLFLPTPLSSISFHTLAWPYRLGKWCSWKISSWKKNKNINLTWWDEPHHAAIWTLELELWHCREEEPGVCRRTSSEQPRFVTRLKWLCYCNLKISTLLALTRDENELTALSLCFIWWSLFQGLHKSMWHCSEHKRNVLRNAI